MSLRYYSNVASTGTLSAAVNGTDTTTVLTLTSALTGWSATPTIAALGYGQPDEEIVLVTAISGSTATVTRGFDGSNKQSHTTGATLRHVVSALDFREPNDHVNATSGVHGVAGAIVGTTDTQTLSNKTLTTPTIGSFANSQHDHGSAAGGGLLPQSSVVNLGTSLAAKADNASVLHLAGTETVAGDKTFSGTSTFSGAVNASGTVTAGTVTATTLKRGTSAVWARDDMVAGSVSGTTDSSGFLTFNHGAPFTPSQAFALLTIPFGGATIGWLQVTAKTSTQLTVRFLLTQGTLPAGVVFDYLVIK